MHMDTKLGRMVIYFEWISAIKLPKPFITCCWKIPWQNLKNYISTTTMPMGPKLGRIVTYDELISPISSKNHLFKQSCDTTWKTKTIISPLTQFLSLKNLARCRLTGGKGVPHRKSHDSFIGFLVRSRNKL